MSAGDDHWAGTFPKLYEAGYVEYADCHLSFTTQSVPETLVSRLHLVAVTQPGVVTVCESVQGWRFLPGGTREPDEALAELARRELLEEAGAAIRGKPVLFAAHQADSLKANPYRPHLPHPRTYWAYGIVAASIVQPPSNPPGGEHVVAVASLPAEKAAEFLAVHDPVHAAVVSLARAMGLV